MTKRPDRYVVVSKFSNIIYTVEPMTLSRAAFYKKAKGKFGRIYELVPYKGKRK
jgi:hypothetical protein